MVKTLVVLVIFILYLWMYMVFLSQFLVRNNQLKGWIVYWELLSSFLNRQTSFIFIRSVLSFEKYGKIEC